MTLMFLPTILGGITAYISITVNSEAQVELLFYTLTSNLQNGLQLKRPRLVRITIALTDDKD